MPDMASNAEDFARRGEPEAGEGEIAASSSGSFKHLYSTSHQHMYCKCVRFHIFLFWIYIDLKLRLVFPAVQENSSAIAILPHFLEVCGCKLDNVSAVQDWLSVKVSVKLSNMFSQPEILDLICLCHDPYLGKACQAWDLSGSGART